MERPSVGSMTVYLFTAYACTAVGRSAQEVVTEVRRQFAENPGIMTREVKPDYSRCVSIVAASALREMIKPGVLAVSAPVLVGVVFRCVGAATSQVRSIQTCFTHRPVSTLDRVGPFQLTDELFLYGTALRSSSAPRRWPGC